MKKYVIMIISFVLIVDMLTTFLILRRTKIEGTITMIGETYIIIESITEDYPGAFILSIEDTTILRDDLNRPIPLDTFVVGNSVEVTFTGGILESDPAQIKSVKAIKLRA